MPTVDFPGMRSMRTDSACIARQRSSARPVTFEYLTPASGDRRGSLDLGGRRALLRMLGDDVAPLLLAPALLAPCGKRADRSRGPAADAAEERAEETAEREVRRQDDREEDQRDDDDHRARA